MTRANGDSRRRRPKRTLVVASIALIVVATFAAHAWNRWPERTRARFFALVAKGELDAANRMLAADTSFRWKRSERERPELDIGDGSVLILPEPELDSGEVTPPRATRSLADRIAGRLQLERDGWKTVTATSGVRGGSITPVAQACRLVFTVERGRVRVAYEVTEPRFPMMQTLDRLHIVD